MGDTLDGKNYCVGKWKDPSKDKHGAIWSLKYHPSLDLLLSISADNLIVIWDCSKLDKTKDNVADIKRIYEGAGPTGVLTCCTWLLTQ